LFFFGRAKSGGGGARGLNVSQHTGRQVLGFQIGSGQVIRLGIIKGFWIRGFKFS
jgi:hypothetical protein